VACTKTERGDLNSLRDVTRRMIVRLVDEAARIAKINAASTQAKAAMAVLTKRAARTNKQDGRVVRSTPGAHA
jgi:hypothetical protein